MRTAAKMLGVADETDLLALGAEVVSRLDALRAPLTEADIARRRPDRLTPRQREIIILRVGFLCKSGYEFAQHEQGKLEAG